MQRPWKAAFIDIAQAVGCSFAGGFVAGFVLGLLDPDATFAEIYGLVAFNVIYWCAFIALMLLVSIRRHRPRPQRSGFLDYHDGT